MCIHMILLWVLLKLGAPAWCYVLLTISFTAKMYNAILELRDRRNNMV